MNIDKRKALEKRLSEEIEKRHEKTEGLNGFFRLTIRKYQGRNSLARSVYANGCLKKTLK